MEVNFLPDLMEAEERVRYYEIKLRDLNTKSKKSKKVYRNTLIAIAIVIIIVALVISFDINNYVSDNINARRTDLFLKLVEIASMPVLIFICTRLYSVNLVSDQLRYECRDKLFQSFVELKKKKPLTVEETRLYMGLFEEL